jgi:hypothetical protein
MKTMELLEIENAELQQEIEDLKLKIKNESEARESYLPVDYCIEEFKSVTEDVLIARQAIGNMYSICDKAGIPIYVEEAVKMFDNIVSKSILAEGNVISVYSCMIKLVGHISEIILNKIPTNKAIEPKGTRMTAITSLMNNKRKRFLKYQINKEGDIRLSEEEIREIKARLNKAKNIGLKERLCWKKAFVHKHLTINKKKQIYVFNNKSHSLSIPFANVASRRDYKTLCYLWSEALKSKNLEDTSCWEDHNREDKRNQIILFNK